MEDVTKQGIVVLIAQVENIAKRNGDASDHRSGDLARPSVFDQWQPEEDCERDQSDGTRTSS
jgi:hypothetical protein